MAEEQEVQPQVEEQTTQEEVKQETPPPAQTPVPEEPKKRPWWEHRIDEVTAKRNAERQRAEAAERRAQQAEEALRAYEKARQGDGKKPDPESEITSERLREEIRKEERSLAAQAALEAQFNETCNKIAQAGKAQFDDFDQSVKALQSVEGLTPEMVLAAAETESPEAVIHALGKDLDEAMRIKALPPMRQAVAIAKLAQNLKPEAKPKKKVSSAPEPITPVSGRGGGEVDLSDDNTDINAWIAARERQIAAKRKAQAH